MEKSKHDYEVEIQTLKQQLMYERERYEELGLGYDSAVEEVDVKNKTIRRMSKLIEILLDRLEREGK